MHSQGEKILLHVILDDNILGRAYRVFCRCTCRCVGTDNYERKIWWNSSVMGILNECLLLLSPFDGHESPSELQEDESVSEGVRE